MNALATVTRLLPCPLRSFLCADRLKRTQRSPFGCAPAFAEAATGKGANQQEASLRWPTRLPNRAWHRLFRLLLAARLAAGLWI